MDTTFSNILAGLVVAFLVGMAGLAYREPSIYLKFMLVPGLAVWMVLASLSCIWNVAVLVAETRETSAIYGALKSIPFSSFAAEQAIPTATKVAMDTAFVPFLLIVGFFVASNYAAVLGIFARAVQSHRAPAAQNSRT